MLNSADNAFIDDKVDEEIADCLNPERLKSFFLFAGAGSGKTHSLVKALQYIKTTHADTLIKHGQKVGVITYTNAARDVIKQRIASNPLFTVSTIHSFAWELVGNFTQDIYLWLKCDLKRKIEELTEKEQKRKSIVRQEDIKNKQQRLAELESVKKFIYSSDTNLNNSFNSLNHAEVLKIFSCFLIEKPLMQEILVRQYPILLIDESQDTNKTLIEALFTVQEHHKNHFSLGLIGDTMQRIYRDGKEDLGKNLPADWLTPKKKLNRRCPKRIISLINAIRKEDDKQEQVPLSGTEEGFVRVFLAPETDNKLDFENSVYQKMAEITEDNKWQEAGKRKTFVLEHRMAADRLGFPGIYDALHKVNKWDTQLLDGKFPPLALFTTLAELQNTDKFSTARIVKKHSPLLAGATYFSENLKKAQQAVDTVKNLITQDSKLCGDILENISDTNLLSIPDLLKPLLKIWNTPSLETSFDEEKKALCAMLRLSFNQIIAYKKYLSGDSPFATQQGIKGLEFPRVAVIIDDNEAKGNLFSYNKLFETKAESDTDLKNKAENKDTTINRTRRLFYVVCSRAQNSLALIIYTNDVQNLKQKLLEQKLFSEDEIILPSSLQLKNMDKYKQGDSI